MKVSATGVYNGFRYIEAPESGLLVLVAQQKRAGKHFTGQPLVARAFTDSTPQVGVLLAQLAKSSVCIANGWLSWDAAEVCFERVLGSSSDSMRKTGCGVLMPLIYGCALSVCLVCSLSLSLDMF